MKNTEVEINCNCGGEVDGKDAWDVEVVTSGNELWRLKEQHLSEPRKNPDVVKIEQDFFVNRHLFELLGDYYTIKQQQKLEERGKKEREAADRESMRQERLQKESELPPRIED